jgi:uncharacterized NAD(P)/FAD-binding protein YdhS
MVRVAIIGGGFCGVVLAAQLIRSNTKSKIQITLINQDPSAGRGLAYGTTCLHHKLNVPAGKMSAFPEEPEHFIRYIQKKHIAANASTFASRSEYGGYLEDLLRKSEQKGPLHRVTGEVIRLEPIAPDGFLIWLSDNRCLHADRVVLALGHSGTALPAPFNEVILPAGRIIEDPWNVARITAIPDDASILTLGSSLTAVDICASLLAKNPNRSIVMLSRHGLFPKPHAKQIPGCEAVIPELFRQPGIPVRALLRAFRTYVNDAANTNRRWEDAMDALRPWTPSIWRNWPKVERQRFLRHVRPYWDNHRHRVAPQTYSLFNAALKKNILSLKAAKVTRINSNARAVTVHYCQRGKRNEVFEKVDFVINCTGPITNVRVSNAPLISQLIRDGMLVPDELGLGLQINDALQPLNKIGRPTTGLYYLGPLLKSAYWEATAVPELRAFASRVARDLLATDG